MSRKLVLATMLTLTLLGACRGGDRSAADPARDVISLDGIGHARGSGTAPVTVVEFSDFGCPYCAQFALATYPALHAEFVSTGQVRWIFVPYVLGSFPNGDVAAAVGECAGEQDRFWPMHDLLYEHQRSWRREGPALDLFMELADVAAVELEELDRCLRQNRPAERIRHQNRVGTRLGIRATPSFVVNGRIVEGSLPLEQFRAVLEYALSEAR